MLCENGQATERQPGDRWMIRGPVEYVPPVEVEVLMKRQAIPLDENEGIYVRDIKTGKVRRAFSVAVLDTSCCSVPQLNALGGYSVHAVNCTLSNACHRVPGACVITFIGGGGGGGRGCYFAAWMAHILEDANEVHFEFDELDCFFRCVCVCGGGCFVFCGKIKTTRNKTKYFHPL